MIVDVSSCKKTDSKDFLISKGRCVFYGYDRDREVKILEKLDISTGLFCESQKGFLK